MTDNSPDSLVGQLLGQYRILSPLGTGGMATVYRAHQVNIDREVAIKVIRGDLSGNADFVKRFEREARLVAQLRHPHILKLFDYGQQGNILYLVMELMTSGTLADMIKRGPLAVQVVTRMLDQLGSALDYAHEHNIVHRDLKPQNVLLDDKENATLSDFGVARLLQENLHLTQTGMAMGTPPYMAPEQWRGESLDSRVDIYALGVMLYEMLTGKLPFVAETTHGMMYQHLMNFPPSVLTYNENFPPAVDAVLNQALAKDRDARFPKASDLASAFKSVVGGMQGPMNIGSASRSIQIPRGPTGTNINTNMPSSGSVPLTGGQQWVTPGGGQPPQSGAQRGVDMTGPMYVDPYQTQAAGFRPTTGMQQSQAQPVATPLSAPVPTAKPKLSQSTMLMVGIGAIALLLVLIVVLLVTRQSSEPTPVAQGSPTAVPVATASAAGLGAVRTDARAVAQVGVPAGCFQMGSDPKKDADANDQEQPVHEVCISRSYWIDTTEVSNANYQKFVDDGGYTKQDNWSADGWKWLQSSGFTGPENRDKFTDPMQPRIGINWYEAQAYAKWRGGRLPTEAEWEYAARGPNALIYPWGNAYQNGQALINEITRGGKAPTVSVAVGSTASDKSWVGALDMAGNVCEWTADWYSDTYYKATGQTDPTGPESGDKKTVRGGSWISSPATARTAFRTGQAPLTRPPNCGFRVAADSPLSGSQGPLTLTILHTADTHANHLPQTKDDVGGDARMATIIKQTRSASPNTLLVDAGGRFTGTLFHRVFAGQDNVQIMNALGYQAMAIGNPEFDNRDAVLAQFIKSVTFPVLSANMDASKSPELAGNIQPYTIVTVGDQKVGIIGLTIADTPTLSSPSANVTFDSNYADIVNRQVVALNGQGINKIILLSYIGYDGNMQLAAQIRGVGVIVSGRDGVLLSNADATAKGKYPNVLKSKDEKPILLVQSGDTARYIGRLTVDFDPSGTVTKWNGDSILLDKSVVSDKEIADLVNNLSGQVDLERARKIRNTAGEEVTVTAALGVGDCRVKECAVGNLVADAMRFQTKTQIAIMNGGGIRVGLPSGSLLRGAILELLPFNNRLSTLKLSGADLIAALENGVSRVGTDSGTGRFPQVSGMRYTYDASKSSGRIVSVDVLGADGKTYTPVDPAAIYTISTNDFERKGGDGYTVFAKNGKEGTDIDLFLDDTLTKYAQTLSKIEPALEGRITVLNPPAAATAAPTAAK